MTINKQALREAAQEEIMLRSVSDTSDAWQDEASPEAVLALLDELEKEKGYASAFEAEKWHYHGLAESEGERADRAEKALEAAENRIAELEQQNSIANEKVTELSRLVQHNISRAEDAERRVESISKSSSLSHPGLLHATNELVLIFSHALADKLYAAQEKYKHGTSWRNNDWQEACQRAFQKHIAKGDPRDVAAYCAFMWWHGWSTKPAEELESRTVTVKLTDINEYLAEVHDKTLNRASRLLAESVRDGDVAAMRADGIGVKGE
ncbi:ead/Ea22-like family protein [Citrobacter braakii]|uniref:ead/Ea22-like family protein n=1 Tax=Citrobacter braakii TaxID=57706 RepID=UPI00242B0166|nr:ead/Ea22-like family protein [Citrobacter braakii]WFW79182.1 ead/Ea22-like family protein [Citrobacter braakii]